MPPQTRDDTALIRPVAPSTTKDIESDADPSRPPRNGPWKWAGVLGAAAFAVAASCLAAVGRPDSALMACAAFATTNLDGLVSLTALLAIDFGTGGRRTSRILLGQGLGITVLIALSLWAASALAVVPGPWMALLGVVPIALGLRTLARRRRERPDSHSFSGSPRWSTWATASVVLSGGADNLAVYIPLFRGLDADQAASTLAVFAGMTVLLCGAAFVFSRLAISAVDVQRRGPNLIPYGYIAIGALVLLRSWAG